MEIGQMAEKPASLGILAALQILMGIALSYFGVFNLILSRSPYGFLLIGGGIIVFILGWEFDNLNTWAWAGTILISSLGLIGFIVRGSWSEPLGDFLSVAPSVIIILHLLTPSVRSQFLPRREASMNVL